MFIGTTPLRTLTIVEISNQALDLELNILSILDSKWFENNPSLSSSEDGEFWRRTPPKPLRFEYIKDR